MTKKVLMTGQGFGKSHHEALAGAGLRVVHIANESVDAIVRDIVDAHAFLLGGDERLTEDILRQGERLEVISFVGTGITEFVDCDYAQSRGIALRNTPGVMAPAVAEHTLGFILGLQRGLFRNNDLSKRDRTGALVPTKSVNACTVGIVGLGAIGRELARLLGPLRCELVYWSRTRKEDCENLYGIEYVALDELFSRADCVVLAVALVPETRGLVGMELLGKVSRPIHLINTAAAALVDCDALKAALDRGLVTSAAFDGYWAEPLPEPSRDAHGLLRYPDSRFVVTPHIAAKTPESWPLMVDEAVRNVTRFYRPAAQ